MTETTEATRSCDRIISPGRRSLLEPQAGVERQESNVSWNEKKKDNLADETKLAGLESLVPEELKEHLIVNSNRLRTFEDARLEVVTYVEAFSRLVKDKESSSLRDGYFKCGGAHLRECKGTGNQSCGKCKQSKSWSKSEPSFSGKGKSKESKGKSKGKSKGAKSANQSAKGVRKDKNRRRVSQVSKLALRGRLRHSGICTDIHH